MTNSKSTKRALVSSALAILMCVAMLIGTTFTWFTDSVTSSGNKIQAGTLNIDLLVKDGEGEYVSVKDSQAAIFDYDLWEPGYTEVRNVKVTTTGNLALKYAVSIVPRSATEDAFKLAEVIDVYYANSEVIVENRDLSELTKIGTLKDFFTTGTVINDTLIPDSNTEDFATIVLKMQESANNDYQGLSVGGGFDLHVVATQYTYEKDSFDDQYDANAHPDAVFGASIAENLSDPEVIEVVAGENIDMSDSTFQTNNYGNAQFDIPDGKTLDLNNNSIIRPDGGSGSGFKFSNGVTSTVTNGSVVNEGDSTAIDIEYGASATFEKVVFKGNGDSMIRVRANGEGEKVSAIFKDCTFTNAGIEIKGMNGASEVDIQFINCTFTGSYYMYDTAGNKLTDKNGYVHYTSCLFNAESNYLYGNISFDNCTFDYDAHEASYAKSVIALYGCYQGSYPGIILNVTLNDVTITAKNAKPVSIDSRYATGLNLVETGTNSYKKDGVAVNYKGETLP
jgi:predicted ribosomally synthesized peptide with SipW-like signal peptide